ncbi:MAG TPA: sensor histidine kinase [Steroidobacteraceae bacterium]|nr:sensor histidine kinase [Steroidobacteraceae bacterium]
MNTASARAAVDKLPDFIEKNREAILQEWDSFAQSLDFERTMSPETQRDHAEQMLNAIANDMRTTESLVEKELKSKGLSPDNSPALKTAGHEHATARLAEQFSLAELVSEFRAIRASVLRLWARQHPNAPAHLNDIVRFNESLDEVLAASSQGYSTKINEARNVIIGILAHDLRNPIHSVMLGTRYLLQNKSTESNGIKAVARMQRAAMRMSELVNNLLDYARTSLGDSIPVFPAPVMMNQICSRAIEEVESAYPGRDITLVCAQDVEGSWDSSRIIQLLTNLLVNALQHGAASGVVSVTVSNRVHSVVIDVYNEGEPISPGSLGTLFHPLYRRASVRDRTHKAQSSGLGLGLFIASQIARSHGGDIKVLSTSEGGTTFSVELPKSCSPLRAATPEV